MQEYWNKFNLKCNLIVVWRLCTMNDVVLKIHSASQRTDGNMFDIFTYTFFFFFFYSIMVYASGGVQHMTQRFCLEFHRLLSSNWQNRREAFIVKESQECVYRHGCSADRIIALTRSFISSNRDEESLVALKGTWIVQFHFILFFININFFLDSCSWN